MNDLATALLAAGAMVITDCAGCVMVVAEARNRGWLAGAMDSIQWLVAITTTTISVEAFSGHDWHKKLLVGGLVTCANLFGTRLGAFIGHRFVTDETTLAERVAALERSMQTKGHM